MSNNMIMLSQRYEDLLSSQKYTDCSFIVDNRMVKCHKLILAAASPVFDAMFYGPIQEENAIEILDISFEVFSTMIKYIYVGTINAEKESIQNLIELYYSAEKYMLQDLIKTSLNDIKLKFRFNNILPAYDLSVTMGLNPLIQACNMFFEKCCMNNCQYTESYESYYYHVSRNCMQNILYNNRENSFVAILAQEWCNNERNNLGYGPQTYHFLLEEMKVPVEVCSQMESQQTKRRRRAFIVAEREYYKACRPLSVRKSNFEYNTWIKSSRYVQLLSLTIPTRLIPRRCEFYTGQVYLESMAIEISTDDQVIHHQEAKFNTDFNCDIDIILSGDIILTVDKVYSIKFSWENLPYEAEYPLSIQSNKARAITFTDNNFMEGSLLKGVKYIELA